MFIAHCSEGINKGGHSALFLKGQVIVWGPLEWNWNQYVDQLALVPSGAAHPVSRQYIEVYWQLNKLVYQIPDKIPGYDWYSFKDCDFITRKCIYMYIYIYLYIYIFIYIHLCMFLTQDNLYLKPLAQRCMHIYYVDNKTICPMISYSGENFTKNRHQNYMK